MAVPVSNLLSKICKISVVGIIGIAGTIFSASAQTQQVFDGPQFARPNFQGQTRAPIADHSKPFEVQEFVTSLTRPWTMAHLPNGKMLVSEVPGRLRIVDGNGTVSAPIKGVPAVRPFGSRGLNDVVLDPDFEKNRTIYIIYHATPDGMVSDNSDEAYQKSNADMAEWGKLSNEEKAANPFGIWRVASARLSTDEKSIDRVKVLLDVVASRIRFDDQGKFLITTQRKSPMGKQDLTGTGGMILRLNKDGSVPKDNPFIGQAGINPMAYVIGLRNSNSLELNPMTGEFWAADQGPAGGDEINVIRPGKNYGWPEVTHGKMGGGKIIGAGLSAKEGTEQPIYYWSPSMAPSSMIFYTGDLFPQWKGNLLVTGLSTQHISRLELVGDHVVGEERLLGEMRSRLRHISQGPDGSVFVIQDGPMAKILKLTPPANAEAPAEAE
jgi:aldose sugar dehydrogenase